MEDYSKPKVTIDLDEYTYLKSLEKPESEITEEELSNCITALLRGNSTMGGSIDNAIRYIEVHYGIEVISTYSNDRQIIKFKKHKNGIN